MRSHHDTAEDSSDELPPRPARHAAFATIPPAAAQVHSPSHLQVQLAPIEAQPWAKDLWSWWVNNTVGIARVDLRRPTPPFPEQYRNNNLFFATYKNPPAGYQYKSPTEVQAASGWRGLLFGGRSAQRVAPPLTGNPYLNPSAPHRPPSSVGGPWGASPTAASPAGFYQAPAAPGAQEDSQVLPPAARSAPPTGARVKITRNLHIWSPDNPDRKGAPIADLGGGINVDMDRGRVDPVLRLKLGGVLAIKAFPMPMFKLSKTLKLGNTGMGLKVLYEVPIEQAHHFYRPPARLMVRLDQMPGTGIKLTPAGIEMDESAVRFGKNLRVRASAGVAFPRSLPFDPESDEFGLKVHRLSLKALW